MEVAGCMCPQKKCSEDFPNPSSIYKVESIFGKVKNLTSAGFLKMNCTTDSLFGNF